MVSTPSTPLRATSCPALRRACEPCLAPRNWLVTTAPPVASAAKMLKIRLLIISTSETPEMAASPTLETITVSDMPTRAASACSMTSGHSSRSSWALVNCFSSFVSIFSFCLLSHHNRAAAPLSAAAHKSLSV